MSREGDEKALGFAEVAVGLVEVNVASSVEVVCTMSR